MPRAKKGRIIPVAPIDKLIREVGAHRVSADAAEKLAEILEDIGKEIARSANELSTFAKRRTVTRKDIELAYKNWKKV